MKFEKEWHLPTGLVKLISTYKTEIFTGDAFQAARQLSNMNGANKSSVVKKGEGTTYHHSFRLSTKLYSRMRFIAGCIIATKKKNRRGSVSNKVHFSKESKISKSTEWRYELLLRKFQFLRQHTFSLTTEQLCYIILAVSKTWKKFRWFHDMRPSSRATFIEQFCLNCNFGFEKGSKARHRSYMVRVECFALFQQVLHDAGFRTEQQLSRIDEWCKKKGIPIRKFKPKQKKCKVINKGVKGYAPHSKSTPTVPTASSPLIVPPAPPINFASVPDCSSLAIDCTVPTPGNIMAESVQVVLELDSAIPLPTIPLHAAHITGHACEPLLPLDSSSKSSSSRNTSGEHEENVAPQGSEPVRIEDFDSDTSEEEIELPRPPSPLEILQKDLLLSQLLAAASTHSAELYNRIHQSLPVNSVVQDYDSQARRFATAFSPDDLIFIAEQLMDQFEDSGLLYGEFSNYVIDSVKYAAKLW